METRIRQIELNGLLFQYRETGEVTAPPLLALHALGQNAASWDHIAAELGHQYRVLALDQRGHGGSARPGVYTFELMCEDLLCFANTLGLEKFTLLGHSMGGTVSFLFAESYPDRIERLIIEDTPPPFESLPAEIPSEPPSEPLPFDWLVIPSIIQQLNAPNPIWWARMPEILAPALIIGGGSTSPIPQNKLKEAADLIPDCELVTIEGSGHFVHEANPQPFLSAVKKFLGI
ncbi:alpha/beta fold hydrolase [Paenibacillus chartarius]|uniref:Alpha/beta fold hydrolase n=1 Tax=Paenibacillus chartarius TaxID=747481 RepID=A0ABV6DHW1_9BACL